MKTVILRNSFCKMGWQDYLQDIYDDYEDFKHYDEIYSLSKRLGYKTSKTAWKANPLVQGSTDPRDFRKADK